MSFPVGQPSLRLYNTLTRSVEPFVSLAPPRVTLYSCGPTVYNYAHLGNFRTFLFVDLLRRWLEARDYRVYHIMNLTDVDDRIITKSNEQRTTIGALVAPFIQAFGEDRDYLKILPAHAQPRATDFVGAMIGLVERLLESGTAYKGDDGSVYFGIARFPGYGQLSQLDRRTLRAGASGRVSADEYDKANAQDFVLWKAAKPEDETAQAAWDAPFGRGRPGWHLECSAMALELIKWEFDARVLDIHTGGVDLIFPHHEDEIAQSCAYTGEPLFARYWLHGEFLNIRGEKMSKRFGNVTTARDLREDGVEPEAVRLLVYQTHYRQRLDLTDEGLAAAREGARRLGDFGARLAHGDPVAEHAEWDEVATRGAQEFGAGLDDDLNAPRAVAAAFEFARHGNRLLTAGYRPSRQAREFWGWVGRILDVSVAPQAVTVGGAGTSGEAATPLDSAPPDDSAGRMAWGQAWAARRVDAKRSREFAEADRIRAILVGEGFEIRDAKDGGAELVDRGPGARSAG